MEARIWLIAGPTASGKSALALAVAREIGGEIVNADALQLYGDLRILSARPSAHEEASAPHHLFGVADPADGWSVGRWLTAASTALAEVAGRDRPAVVVGGTGLYFRALTQGLADIPPIPRAARDAAEQAYDAGGEAAARAALRALDPLAEARISPGDRQRLTRALAVARATGRPLSAWQAETRAAIQRDAWRAVVLAPPREGLYARIDERLAAMAKAGAVEEAAALMRRGLDPRLPAMKAVGLRELAAHAAGELTLDQAIAAAQQATRRYAKRQLTWFRNQTPDWPRIAATAPDEQWEAFLSQLRSPAR
jgi:tRNA dimethylallyltransferase